MLLMMLRCFLVNIFVQLVKPVAVDRVTTKEWLIMVFVLYLVGELFDCVWFDSILVRELFELVWLESVLV